MDILASKVKEASIKLAVAGEELKNKALLKIAESLAENKDRIIEANNEDISRSEKENLPGPLLKRLKFDNSKIDDAIEGIYDVIKLEDPVGKTLLSTELDEGLELYKISCPIGVIGVIFESRPDALVQISTLCLKSGNAVLLKGGSEARETNRVLTEIIMKATEEAGIPSNWITLLDSRADVMKMLKMDKYVDLIIPRGSNEFVRYIMENSSIPVMGHADGVCNCYVDKNADIDLAIKIAVDSKTQYVAACNTIETLLVDENIAQDFLPKLKDIFDEKQVELIGDDKTAQIIPVTPATEDDWRTEYLDYKLSVKVVSGLEEAIDHINKYGSNHTDVIVTKDKKTASKFLDLVDSGCVFWNCSSRFSDGFRFGFGAEVGISTSKIHSRGPVGLEGLVIYKYKLLGNGQIVDDYSKHVKSFKHTDLKKDFSLED